VEQSLKYIEGWIDSIYLIWKFREIN